MIWRWVSKQVVIRVHDTQISTHGGLRGLRDDGLLESALARPRNLALYAQPDVYALAAAYAVGLAKNHAFIDGNKRTAFVTSALFLAKNGCAFDSSEREVVAMLNAVATSTISEDDFALWLSANSK